MEAKELRIGNFVQLKEKVVTINQVNPYEYLKHKPIQLTEEWLLKFGFKAWGSYKYLWKLKTHHAFTINTYSNIFNLNEYHFRTDDGYLKNVHQLQNLFYALTGEELTLK